MKTEMMTIKAGSFEMGSSDRNFTEEMPVHTVNISYDFEISRYPVKWDEYLLFHPDCDILCNKNGYVTGISWYDANEYCRWLSRKEGKNYRLPTEAEWEYTFKNAGEVNYGQYREDGVFEWCHDWYGQYPAYDMTDPFGAENGHAKVIRGGSPDEENPKWGLVYKGITKRASAAPGYGYHPNNDQNMFGLSGIGFRIVNSPVCTGSNTKERIPFACVCVKQKNEHAKEISGKNIPYFKKRPLLPIPPDNCTREEIDAAGFHPAMRGHNHSPAFEVCGNGDLLHITYSSYREYEPGTHLIVSRLRYGSLEWDMPDLFYDFANINDHSPLLWNDDGILWFFWGNPRLINSYPFNFMKSHDNGRTWSEVKYPRFANHVGGHTAQPINSAFRTSDKDIYLSSDAIGASSVIWHSCDNGLTWNDTTGRTAGRHSAFVELADGSILAMGGKNSNIDGFMPKSVSKDGGKTWITEASIFPALTNSQRPSLIRLKSGRLFFAADFQNKAGEKPASIKENGSYAALSDDEGVSWIIKKIPCALPHEEIQYMGGHSTIGYSVARQAPNGMIHLITSMNDPCTHFEFNEAWILSDRTTPDALDLAPDAMISAKEHVEYHNDGSLMTKNSYIITKEGRFLLHGTETWFYPSGNVQRRTRYHLGHKTGVDEFYENDGTKIWLREYHDNDRSTLYQYYPSGKLRSEVSWKGFAADGQAVLTDENGGIISTSVFKNGRLSNV